ncbi:hypothetical protein SBRY_50497 [Actinacidiphila bryophytorum]|uniref:Uncharacterized protein n=1 Tax=Actinacidiphila bryophytorum TaxID=1436133 RepID=A0A9W4H511_9ACTN|nr:hypothetical protein SBRY_50497 [Actinacidiphila bryophytorum]
MSGECRGTVRTAGGRPGRGTLPGVQKSTLVTHIQRMYYSDNGRRVETADIVVPAALCENVYEVPVC